MMGTSGSAAWWLLGLISATTTTTPWRAAPTWSISSAMDAATGLPDSTNLECWRTVDLACALWAPEITRPGRRRGQRYSHGGSSECADDPGSHLTTAGR